MLRSLLIWLSAVGGVWAQASYTLPFRPLDADYSVPLNRIIMVGSAPNQLHIYDPATQVDVAVNLAAAPLDLSLSPNGLHAAVGHNGSISYVNLFTGTVERIYSIPGQATSLVAGSSYLYVELQQESSRILRTVDLLSGTLITSTTGSYSLLGARVHPRGDAIYAGQPQYYSPSISKIPLRNGLPENGAQPNYSSRPQVCNGTWVSADGESLFNACGSVFWSSLQPALELQYRGSFSGLSQIRSLWEFSGRNELAVIPVAASYPQSGLEDSEIQLYAKGSLRLTGRLILASTPANGTNHPTRGRWVFGDGASELYVIAQTDTSAGLAQDFSLRIFDLATTAACPLTLNATTASAAGEGGLLSVNVTAGGNCVYRLDSPVPWLQVAGETLRSGQRTIEYIVRPNPGAARTGTLNVGGQTLTVNQAAAPAPLPSPLPLGFRLKGADYSKSLDRLIALSTDPPELHVLNPLTNEERVVALRIRGISVAVDPAGTTAAVGHDGWVSLVNLAIGAVTREYPVTTDAQWIVWGGNGYLYVFGTRSGSPLLNLKLDDGTWTSVENTNDLPHGELQPGSSFLYAGTRRWSTQNGPLTPAAAPQNQSFSCANQFWFYEQGDRMVTLCGDIRRVTGNPVDDLTLAGRLSSIDQLRWAEHNQARRTLAVVAPVSNIYSNPITDEVRLYGDDQLGLAGRMRFATGVRGRYVFWNANGSALFALGAPETSNGVESAAQVMVISTASTVPGCTATFVNGTATVPMSESTEAAAVSTGSSCGWTATSTVPWLRILAGSFGIGPSSLTYAVETNRLTVVRTGTIVLSGGATLTVTQNPSPVAVEPVSVTIGSAGGARTFAVTTAISATSWTASATVPWVTFPTGATGTGNGTVSYTVAANTGAARSGLIRVNSANFSILQEAGSSTGIPNSVPAFVSTRDLFNQRREFVFRDPNGADDLGVVNILINRALDGRAACYVAYNAATEQLYLVDDAGTGLLELPATPPTATVENSQCAIDRAGLTAVKSADRLTLSLTIRTKPLFRNPLAVYAAARDRAEANSGWQAAAVIVPSRVQGTLDAEPSQSSDLTFQVGQSVNFQVRYTTTDLSSAGAITTMQVLINRALDGANACYIGIDRAARRAYLVSDNGLELLGTGVALNSSSSDTGSSENSQCVLRSAGSGIFENGASSITLSLTLQFKSNFAGTKLAYGGAQAAGAARNSGWHLLQAVKLE